MCVSSIAVVGCSLLNGGIFILFIPCYGSLPEGTPWKTNMSPENQWLEDVFPIEIVPF